MGDVVNLRTLEAPPCQLVVGDSVPQARASVELDVDPAGATVETELWRRGESAPIEVDGAALVTGPIEGAWQLELTSAWTEEETAALAPGYYFARFRVTLAGGDRFTAPPDDRLTVHVFGAAAD